MENTNETDIQEENSRQQDDGKLEMFLFILFALMALIISCFDAFCKSRNSDALNESAREAEASADSEETRHPQLGEGRGTAEGEYLELDHTKQRIAL